MIIKKATHHDYEKFFKLFCEVQNLHNNLYPKIFKKSSNSAFSKKIFREYIDKDNTIFIAYENDISIGYVYISIKPEIKSPIHFKPKNIYIHQLCVAEKFRRKGVAKELINHVIKFAKSKKINLIQLDVWDLNKNAQISFKKLGFKAFNIKMEMLIN